MKVPRVSILMPVYNRDWCVGDALKSVFALDLDEWELVVVDDGSTDNTADVLCQASRDSRVTLLHHAARARRGIAASRNLAARVARAPLLAFLDSDDLYFPHRFASALSTLDARTDLAACVEPYVTNTYPTSGLPCLPEPQAELHLCAVESSDEGWLRAMLYENTWWNTPSITLRRSVFEALGGFDERLPVAEDTALWLRLAAGAKVGVAQSASAVALVRRHQSHSWDASALAGVDRQFQSILVDLVSWARQSGQVRSAALAILRERLTLSLVQQLSDGSQPLPVRLRDAARALKHAPVLVSDRRIWANLLRSPWHRRPAVSR